ncbi:MAG TPA: glycosyltransferase family 39 protein [Steroidobacteraceae bacterium]|nr:glycosyltransferase family 39 protein [Steroidobacteraceae bacterium]
MNGVLAALLRPGRTGYSDERLDLYWLIGLSLLLIATGIGLRDPWPADEPRFALVARDMVATGQWLIPQVGGDLYADKPPLFFWMISAFLVLTHSLRVAFLLPSLLAGIGCVLLVYDLAKRLWNREVALHAGLALLATLQFVWQARQAQIDATLCFWTTLGLYGFLRHVLAGPAWRWYYVGWAAAGLGIITKGVGFLPLLILIPYAVYARKDRSRQPLGPRWKWALGPLALLAAVCVWLVPMLVAALHDPAIAAYRDNILFKQTVNRYASAWHHREPFYYFIVSVIPGLWLPLTALIPWLIKPWREGAKTRDLRVLLPLTWVVLVVLFFSFSSGKRGVYVLPAVPALVLAVAPFLRQLAEKAGPRRLLFGIAVLLAGVTFIAGVVLSMKSAQRAELIESYDIDVVPPLLAIGVSAALCCLIARVRYGFAAFFMSIGAALLVVSFAVNPTMNDARSGRAFVQTLEARTAGFDEVGIAGYKEQYLLYITRPLVNFGHARWREAEQEANDAAAWLNAAPGRALVVESKTRQRCFGSAQATEVDEANSLQWFVVSGRADPECAARGSLNAARTYSPPRT